MLIRLERATFPELYYFSEGLTSNMSCVLTSNMSCVLTSGLNESWWEHLVSHLLIEETQKSVISLKIKAEEQQHCV